MTTSSAPVDGGGRGDPPAAGPGDFDAGRAYELHPQVAIRDESFGGLAYHYGNRRLTFLKAKPLVEIVQALGRHPSALAAVEASVPAARRDAYLRALAALLVSEVIRVR